METPAQILDCTIRDGSYVVDYQFTVEDTYIVAHGIAAAGIRHIEVGHGLGLNAQNCGKGNAAISDIEYITAAKAAVPDKALIGSFFIPGIGTEDSLRAAADAGLGFIRLGIDVDDHTKLEPFVKLAKSLNLEVWGNMMKSYLLPPEQFAEVSQRVGEFGVDVVAIVDSAGGMTPNDVAAYTQATLARSSRVPLAFHGHNNLTLAVANCLRFVECGGVYVDGSLAGLGRSGGNAATELLAAVLSQRNSLAWPIDWERLVEFADSVMQFCVPDHARPRASEIATGLNYFHSSFSPVVEKANADAKAPLYRTILRLPKDSRKKVSQEVAVAAAQQAASEPRHSSQISDLPSHGDSLERLQPASLAALADRLRVQKGKSPQRRVVTIAHTPDLIGARIGPVRSSRISIVAHVEVSTTEALTEVQNALADSCDFWLLDKRLEKSSGQRPSQPQFLYDDDAVIAQAVADALQMLQDTQVSVIGDDAGQRAAIGQIIQVVGNHIPVNALVTSDSKSPASKDDLLQVRDGGAVLMVRARALTDEAFAEARRRGIQLWRLDCGPALVAEAERLIHTYDRFHLAAGQVDLDAHTHIVAGGTVGQAGDLVVDHLRSPRFILGEADGQGGIRPLSEATRSRTLAAQQWIVDQWGL